ncbi:ABC transporter substrate-binding protein [Tumebacillus algifaecis]|uniref:ABC transporter substrate-binding protein n=1 Tax=Tumebacillus algifaecis TaxID=1214604 RepID=A0A223D420_9BACL|nr:transporter substrate-binding domain-containing protein [Tumebacillus algifaecis]ASS76197.1 ABC transporter substrate-binding protein [Tumebacillus algifaecis]
MKKFKSLCTIALTTVLALGVVACGTDNPSGNTGSEAGKKKIVMGTSADYPPYEYHDTSKGGEVVGFDVDIAKSIADQLGYTLEVKDMDFNGLIPALQAGTVDFVMAGMTPTEERKQSVDFSDIYFEAKNTIVAKKGSKLATPESLSGKKVAVQLGSIQESAAKDMPGLNIVPLNKTGEIIQEIKAGRVDAAIIEDTVAKGFIEANKDLEFNMIPKTEEAGSAIAFPKNSDKTADFNKALKAMKDSGQIESMVKNWFEAK